MRCDSVLLLKEMSTVSPEHWILLDDDVACWNRWRKENPDVCPNLSGLTLSRRHLESVDLSRCNLVGTHLNYSDLSNADLTRANMSGASLQGANLKRARGQEMYAAGSNFTRASLENSDLRCADLTNTHLTEANLSSSELSGIDISRAILFEANLQNASLMNARALWSSFTRADLSKADLYSSDLTGASFIETNLSECNLRRSNLRLTRFIDSQLTKADISKSSVYGVSVWNVASDYATQSDLVITPPDEATITVDNLELAQFIYLLLNSGSIRRAIDTITSKVALILGRFTPDRAVVLEGIRASLRTNGYLPILFDFSGPSSRDLTETISTLAHLARFVLADVTEAKSIPQELMAIVPNLPSVPIQPLLLKSKQEYGMFEHFRRYPWVSEVFIYEDVDHLLSKFDQNILRPLELALAQRQPANA